MKLRRFNWNLCYKLSKSVEKVKLIGSTAKDLVAKIKDEKRYNHGKIIMERSNKPDSYYISLFFFTDYWHTCQYLELI